MRHECRFEGELIVRQTNTIDFACLSEGSVNSAIVPSVYQVHRSCVYSLSDVSSRTTMAANNNGRGCLLLGVFIRMCADPTSLACRHLLNNFGPESSTHQNQLLRQASLKYFDHVALTTSTSMENPADLTSDLRALTRHFEGQHQHQPRATRKILTIRTRNIFQNYGKHGNSTLLRQDLRDFLEGDETGIEAVDLTEAEQQAAEQGTAAQSPSTIEKKGGARMVDPESAPFMHAPTPSSMIHGDRDLGDGGLPFTFDKTFTISGDVLIPEVG